MKAKIFFKIGEYFKFEPHVSFFALRAFRWSIGVGGVLAAFSASVIVFNSDLYWSFDYEGFNFAISVFKVPLGILATLIPVIALLAANHRSVQTQEQIRVTSANNNFSNFFRHKDEFKKYLEARSEVQKNVTDWMKLHNFLFPNARAGELAVSLSLNTKIIDLIANINECLSVLSESHKSVFLEKMNEIDTSAKFFFDDIGMKVISSQESSSNIKIDRLTSMAIPGGDFRYIFSAIGRAINSLIESARFDLDYSDAEGITFMIIKLEQAPPFQVSDFVNSPPDKVYKYSP